MLCWVMCWLHGHVVCDGNVMVGKMGEAGWGNGQGDGVGDHTSLTIVHDLLSAMHSSLEVVGVSVVR